MNTTNKIIDVGDIDSIFKELGLKVYSPFWKLLQTSEKVRITNFCTITKNMLALNSKGIKYPIEDEYEKKKNGTGKIRNIYETC